MKRSLGIGRLLLVLFVGLSFTGAAGAAPSLIVELDWTTAEGGAETDTFPAQDIQSLYGRGLWLAFETSGEEHVPVIHVGGSSQAASVPVEQMESLTLRLTVRDAGPTFRRSFTVFDRNGGAGFRGVLPQNVYHVLVFQGMADTPRPPLDLSAMENAEMAQAFERTRGLALNYVRQSDEKARQLGEIFGVDADYDLPRLILVAEQWLDVPKEEAVQEESSGGGLFGGLGAALEEKMELVPEVIPTYTIDVLQNDILASGQYAIGFQAARSWWNDVLEGAVIYQATGGKRHVLTASTLFAQMQKNIAERGSENHVLDIRADEAAMLDQCERLWEPVKAEIAAFLSDNPGWHVLIPAKPVIFYGDDDQPIYETYAWFEVDPETGRMTGRLPRGAHGAVSDELERAGGALLDRAEEALSEATGGVKGFFSQIAGLYVGAAGIIDAVAMTIADPSLAAMDNQAWLEFAALHALAHAQQFLEDNADQYDSYAAILGFWQGAMIWPSELGGAAAARDAAQRAWDSVQNKAENDARSFVEDQLENAQNTAGEAAREALDRYAPELGAFADGIDRINDAVDQANEWGANAAEAEQRLEAVVNELTQNR